jgi:hypothetical protein
MEPLGRCGGDRIPRDVLNVTGRFKFCRLRTRGTGKAVWAGKRCLGMVWARCLLPWLAERVVGQPGCCASHNHRHIRRLSSAVPTASAWLKFGCPRGRKFSACTGIFRAQIQPGARRSVFRHRFRGPEARQFPRRCPDNSRARGPGCDADGGEPAICHTVMTVRFTGCCAWRSCW